MNVKKIKQTDKGITLIALVITIIVLLILAGVTIATLTGDNGILTKANDAKEQTIIGEEKEAISIAYSACKAKDYSKNVTDSELQAEIEKIKDNVQVTSSGEYLIILYIDTQHRYKLSQDGKIEKIEETQGDLEKIVDMLNMNIGITAGGKVIYIEDDTYDNNFRKLNTENYTTITEKGIRKSIKNGFIDNEGKVYTWGDNEYGQLGDGTNENSDKPICISELDNDLKGKNITDIYLDVDTVIALDNEGKVYTWGDNEYGQLGDGTTEVGYDKYRNIPICISDLENDLKEKTITDIYYSNNSVIIALDNEGKVYTWGDNEYGQLGDGTNENSDMPICISELENDLKGKTVTDIYSNRGAIIALDNEGKVYTWGDNEYGQLGDGTNENSDMPICISNLENDLKEKTITDIYYSNDSTIIALDNEGKVYTWGHNFIGELGDGITEIGWGMYRNSPICISDLENDLKGKKITKLYLNYNTIIAIDNEGKVYTWGHNFRGELGDGTTEDRNIPICISDLENDLKGKKIMDVYPCRGTIIALDNEGKIYTWGDNQDGELGDGTNENSYMPICISNLENDLKEKNITNIYCGGDTIAGLDNEGNLYTWGNNCTGQLGDGTEDDNNIPVCVSKTEESELYKKNILNIKFIGKYEYFYITEEGEIYFAMYKPVS